MATQVEKRRIRAHDDLLVSVIKRQAGTLHKAILEAVMNAVDAQAKEIRLKLTSNHLSVHDDGHGIPSRQAILDFWETFGQPPAEGEQKTYGQFRMGRGQLFAFGKNIWRTGDFQMRIDVNGSGMDYELEKLATPVRGCQIEIDLYDEVPPSLKAQIERDLSHSIKYVPCQVYFNDELLSVDPDTVAWDEETDEAYIRLKDQGSLSVFNLGVLVCNHPTYRFGVGGEVVSKRQLMVNFARNEVMSTCPVWKKIQPLVDQRAQVKISRQPALTDAARQRLAEQFKAGELSKEEAQRAKVLTDVNGRHHSLEKLNVYQYKRNLTVARHGDQQGSAVQAHKLAFVLSEITLERFGVSTLQRLVAILDTAARYEHSRLSQLANLVKLESLTSTLNDSHELIEEDEWLVGEKIVLGTLNSAILELARSERTDWMSIPRILLGRSETSMSWTDGKTFIALNREYIAANGVEIGAWVRYGHLLTHNLRMVTAGTDVMSQSPEFYQGCLGLAAEALPGFVERCVMTFPKQVENLKRKLTKEQLKVADKVAKHEKAERDFMGLLEPSGN